MTWTRYAAWSRLLFFPGFALFIASAMAPAQRGLLSWLQVMGWCVGIIILLAGLPVLIKQLTRYEPPVGLGPNVASLGWQGLTTGAAGLFLVLIGLITEYLVFRRRRSILGSRRVAGIIFVMVGIMVTAVWRAQRNQEKRIRRTGAHTNSVELH